MTDRAVVVQRVARLPFLAEGGGASPTPRLHFTSATVNEVNPLLSTDHYLGPIGGGRSCFAGWANDVLVACQVWRWPTARMLPSDGTWLELSRWCLTPDAGRNAGSRMMRWAASQLRQSTPRLVTGVSYSDPAHGHTGALYKASGWRYAPTHIGERYDRDGIGYLSGNGSWDGETVQSSKHRWLYNFACGANPVLDLDQLHLGSGSGAAGTQVPGGNPLTVQLRDGAVCRGTQLPGGNPAVSALVSA